MVEEILFKAKQDKRKKLLQERARKNYEKHYQICHSIILQMVDLSTKIGEYRELTQGYVTCTCTNVHMEPGLYVLYMYIHVQY